MFNLIPDHHYSAPIVYTQSNSDIFPYVKILKGSKHQLSDPIDLHTAVLGTWLLTPRSIIQSDVRQHHTNISLNLLSFKTCWSELFCKIQVLIVYTTDGTLVSINFRYFSTQQFGTFGRSLLFTIDCFVAMCMKKWNSNTLNLSC